MSAHEVNGYTRVCPKPRHGEYISGAGCPICAGVQKPAPRPKRFVNYAQEIEAALRRRPKSGPATE